ncbi:hypothetical protein DTO013E5_5831 [Penicillium roqueforti]|uniref:Genomic scaffold, ProqFM164S01 n=1 Tax=Penicillium roqueforti (strain FM164) TaxID=1365484 RepID=W6QHM7_PENRF|nr:uncharacterized protein LCP9604111_7235 [Penicillium roqueforti]CDM29117.1 unnamed protein product [Penicillium roqueforti FM164]KAF9244282.1 hypothetical protein LCP9604111_7235 [Penicillium roqueforti]KAI1835863.1 hypothetical protein CBS147337_3012 [Penicillium roqueforti]KAI2678251.1 hypothetical protein LCP963914a_7682 [Penicillium roqueforti]KAI2682885.1 hypothetical protein CBS147355_2025 [Penicillium roqueforti]
MKSPTITTQEAVESCLPDLLKATHKTLSSAIHKVKYIGPLSQWQDFEEDVKNNNPKRWTSAVIDYRISNRDLRQEEVYVADETGVQGRFQQAVGQVLGAVFRAEKKNLRFGDFKSAGITYDKTPDIAMVSPGSPVMLRAVGELKVPWVMAHNLRKRYGADQELRLALGQVLEYMIDLRLPYGFHSTYEETIFLRHVQVNGQWRVEYSPVIQSTATDVSLKKCFWHLSSLALQGNPVQNPALKDDLVTDEIL